MKSKLIILFLLISFTIFSQKFEGEIIYKNICKSNRPNWKIEYCELITDSIENFHYKDGTYKYSVPKKQTWTIYKENKMYSKNKDGKIFCNNPSSINDSIIKVTLNKKALNVLGYKCDELVLESAGLIRKYYYSSKLKTDPNLYKNLKIENIDSITSITKSIPLKTIFIIESQGLTLESTALKIIRKKISNDIFLIPDNVELTE